MNKSKNTNQRVVWIPRLKKKKNRDGGRMIHVAPHPPDFVSFPWINIIIRIADPPTAITDTLLHSAIVSQIGLTPSITTYRYVVRMQSVRVWGAIVPPNSGTVLPPVTMLVFDPINEGSTGHVLEQITGFPDMFQRAAVGYHYPKAQREYARILTGSAPLVTLSGVGVNSVAYFHVQLRINQTVPPSNFSSETPDFTPASAPPAGWRFI
jgi:hypothetical protein